MDPLTMGLAAIGLATQVFGGFSAASHAKEAYGIQSQITGLEGQVNQQRKQAMELSARRQSMEIFRQNQRAQSMAINNATNQGANYGNSSGLAGGLSQINSQSSFNLEGINQNLQIGENIFGLDDKISKQKLALSQVQSSQVTDQAISNLGGSLIKISPTAGNIFGAAKNGVDLSSFGFNPIKGVSGQ